MNPNNHFNNKNSINEINDFMENGGLDDLFKNESVTNMFSGIFGNSMDAGVMKKMMKSTMDAMSNVKFDPNNPYGVPKTEENKAVLKKMGKSMQDAIGEEKMQSMLDNVTDNFVNGNMSQNMTDIFANFPAATQDTSNIQRYINKIFKKDIDRDEYFKMSFKSKPSDCNENCFICRDKFEKEESCCKCGNGHTLHKECYFEFLEINDVRSGYECLYCKDQMSKYLFKY